MVSAADKHLPDATEEGQTNNIRRGLASSINVHAITWSTVNQRLWDAAGKGNEKYTCNEG